MKKVLIISVLFFSAIQMRAQSGELAVGAQGGYITYYKSPLYGMTFTYHLSTPLQLSLSGLINPNISLKEGSNTIPTELYTVNVDLRFLLLNFDILSTGPSIGLQYMRNIENSAVSDKKNIFGPNLGWYVKYNLTENLRLTGGWQYSNMKKSSNMTSYTYNFSYHMFYVGLSWAFNTY